MRGPLTGGALKIPPRPRPARRVYELHIKGTPCMLKEFLVHCLDSSLYTKGHFCISKGFLVY